MEISNERDLAYIVYLCAAWVDENVELSSDEKQLINKIREKACDEKQNG